MRVLRIGVAVYAAALPASALAIPQIHAHRGGPTLDGRHVFGEETLAAFRNAWEVEGAVIELDAKLTSDDVPVVFHDATLDRTTTCEGRVDARTRSELEACPVDVVGSPGYELGGAPAAVPDRIPSLAEALAYATASGATVNLEIKNVPTEPDFDPTPAFAGAVMDVVLASGLPVDRLIVQSFWPPNLDVADQRLPGVATAILTQSGSTNPGGPLFATGRGIEWVSPQWPVDADYVQQAHALGRKVVPYTINTADGVKAAAALGVDAIITDDPRMARRALGIAAPALPGAPPDAVAPRARLRLPPLASDLGTSRRVNLRWTGTDVGSGIEAYALDVRTRSPRRDGPWRAEVGPTPRTLRVFEGRAGVTYGFRLRARDRAGNVSRYARDELTVPLDQRSLRLGGAWRTVRRPGAWGGTVAVARRPGARAAFRFTGRRLWLVAPTSRRGGRLAVSVGGRRYTVRLRSRRQTARRRVLAVLLPSRRHTVRIRAAGRGEAALDAVAHAP